jgi:hypothetical protein
MPNALRIIRISARHAFVRGKEHTRVQRTIVSSHHQNKSSQCFSYFSRQLTEVPCLCTPLSSVLKKEWVSVAVAVKRMKASGHYYGRQE